MRSIGSMSCLNTCRQIFETVSQMRIVQSSDAEARIRRVSGWGEPGGRGCQASETMGRLWPMSVPSGFEFEPLEGLFQT